MVAFKQRIIYDVCLINSTVHHFGEDFFEILTEKLIFLRNVYIKDNYSCSTKNNNKIYNPPPQRITKTKTKQTNKQTLLKKIKKNNTELFLIIAHFQ